MVSDSTLRNYHLLSFSAMSGKMMYNYLKALFKYDILSNWARSDFFLYFKWNLLQQIEEAEMRSQLPSIKSDIKGLQKCKTTLLFLLIFFILGKKQSFFISVILTCNEFSITILKRINTYFQKFCFTRQHG